MTDTAHNQHPQAEGLPADNESALKVHEVAAEPHQGALGQEPQHGQQEAQLIAQHRPVSFSQQPINAFPRGTGSGLSKALREWNGRG